MTNIFVPEQSGYYYVSKLFQIIGASKEHADTVADHLTTAEMRGQASHGFSRIPFYTSKLKNGGYKITPDIRILSETAGTALLDGDDALGAVSGVAGMKLCMNKASQTGCAAVSVTNSNHIGFLAYYTMLAASKDMIGIAICNSGSSTAVSGTAKPVLGTNPFSIAVPTGLGHPIVLDCATSVVAQGKVAVADLEQQPIPGHWAYNAAGEETTNAREALNGAMRPFGDYKGSGISMMISLISCILSGMPFDMEEENLRRIHDLSLGSALSCMFLAIDISAFIQPSEFKHRADIFTHLIKSYEPLPGVREIYMPGEKEFLEADRSGQRGGFMIGPNLFHTLKELASDYNLAFDFSGWHETTDQHMQIS